MSVLAAEEAGMAREKLGKQAVEEAMAGLGGWTLAANGLSISRTFTFKNFSEAFAFMTRSALAAEKLDHHPDWSNVYKTVEVRLNTHDAGGLTALDFELAKRMNRYAGSS
jgi:4a-hydroxytetrahydrobiopterin dehydratase